MYFFHSAIILTTLVNLSFQDCPQEVSVKGMKVTWPSTSSAENVTSRPLCFRYERIVTRNCNGTHWEPFLDQMQPCQQIANYFDLSNCPPGHYRISEKSNYCYQIIKPSAWNHPCYKSGKTFVITDLDINEMKSLLTSLNKSKQKFYWLPAQRSKLYNPVVWQVPGPNWGRLLELNSNHNLLKIRTYMMRNCLLLDVEHKTVLTEMCSMEYPSLCLSINVFRYPSNCPDNYHGLRFIRNDTTCYGIEKSDNEDGLTFDEFVQTKCPKPSPSQNLHSYRERIGYVFTNLAALSNMSKTAWCWFQIFPSTNTSNNNNSVSLSDEYSRTVYSETQSIQGIINSNGTLSITKKTSKLPCMACEIEIKLKETDLIIEYSEVENKMHLTVYYPSGLWKNDENDKGVQCFSNAKGFVKVIDVNNKPVLQKKLSRGIKDFNDVDKIVYEIDLVTNRAAQYWCEGHTINFSLVTTNRLVVNPKCNEEHVFATVIEMPNIASDTEEPDTSELTLNVTEIFRANKVLIMDILDFSMEHILVLMHLHVDISSHEDKSSNIQETFFALKEKAEVELPKYNYTFVNISSSLFCLPTVTANITKLNWDLTPIGHIAAPQQFCLQTNGLPVKRSCYGSYLLGGTWGDVEGICDSTYEPSWTTKFLFDFVKGNIPDNFTTHFLTKGLGAVLEVGNNIIPADIYYLSISLQHVLYLAENNQSVDLGDIDNMAWVMDRVMSLDKRYLKLSQTLNSTNVILDSVNDIIEHLIEEQTCDKDNSYFLTVKSKFVVQISYPRHNNITGIAIIQNKDSNDFTEMLIQPLFKNSTLSEVLAIPNLEVATWLSNEILESMIFSLNHTSDIFKNNSDLHIVINVFYNDVVFQEVNIKRYEINSRVIGISIPGYTSNLKYGIPLIFKDLKTYQSGKTFCGYWNFKTDVTRNRNTPGLWAKNGCFHFKSVNSVTVCECYHLTHFGQLVNVGGNSANQEIQIHHNKVLNIITLIGSFLSLAGIVGIWVTASVFSAWRQKAGTKVLLHLSTTIAMPLIFIVVFNVDTTIFIHEEGVYKVAEHMKVTCIILGALLHYSILASFTWMFITAALQFFRYVRVLGVYRPSRFMIKCTVVGWGVPLIPVSVILLIEKENYIPEPTKTDFGKYLICYPSGFILVMSVIVPICVILAINIALFVIILCSIYRGPDGKMRTTDIDLIGAQFRLSIFLFFLLGLTWMFGIMSFTNNLLWSYLFCLTSTLQGFVLFVYFIICDPNTRNLWITLMTPNFRITRPRESITSISSG